MPWFTDAGMLFYRKDLLEAAGKEAPKTWAELAATAKELQDQARAGGNDRMWGYVFQGKAYEGLTCNGLEWIDSWGGGTIVDADGKITVNNAKAAEARRLGRLDRRHDRARGRAQLQRRGGARRLPVRQRDLHAQLALRLVARPGRRQPDQGQDRRRRPARPAVPTASHRHAGRLAARGFDLQRQPRCSRSTSCAYLTSRGRAEAARHRGLLQPDHRGALPGPGDPDRGAVLRLALRRVRQRRGAARRGSPGSSTTR